jgi:hypothetical protein
LEIAEEVVLLDAPPHLQRALRRQRNHPRLLSQVCRNCGVSFGAFVLFFVLLYSALFFCFVLFFVLLY